MKGITLLEGEIAKQKTQAVVGEEHSTFLSERADVRDVFTFSAAGSSRGIPHSGKVSVGSAVHVAGEESFGSLVIYAVVREPGSSATEMTIQEAFRSCLYLAEVLGVESLSVPAIGTVKGEISTQKSAEILLSEVRKTNVKKGCLSDINFVLKGEPSYRVFEMVKDSVKIADQLARLKGDGRV
jgi:O-acetyl-ADP-ribose deacetylase (regulator of RNase III)